MYVDLPTAHVLMGRPLGGASIPEACGRQSAAKKRKRRKREKEFASTRRSASLALLAPLCGQSDPESTLRSAEGGRGPPWPNGPLIYRRGRRGTQRGAKDRHGRADLLSTAEDAEVRRGGAKDRHGRIDHGPAPPHRPSSSASLRVLCGGHLLSSFGFRLTLCGSGFLFFLLGPRGLSVGGPPFRSGGRRPARRTNTVRRLPTAVLLVPCRGRPKAPRRRRRRERCCHPSGGRGAGVPAAG